MIAELKFAELINKTQKCPLCFRDNKIVYHGTEETRDPDKRDGWKCEIKIHALYGYSKCACRNIVYTDWENIDQDIYTTDYVKKYWESDRYMEKYADVYFEMIPKKERNGTFLEIGSASDALLDKAKEMGWIPFGLDIADRPSKHIFLKQDFEGLAPSYLFNDFSLIAASHVFEHFKDPIKALKKCHTMLKNGGYLFIAMPDIYFIKDFEKAWEWPHFHFKEHHILWEMNEWVKLCEENGFECVYKTRNKEVENWFICHNDFHVLLRKNANPN